MSIVIENAILSYPHLFTAKPAKGSDKPRFSVSLILPENFDWTEVKQAVVDAKNEKWGQHIPATLKSQIKKVPEGPYKGRYCISANSNEEYPPEIVDQNVNPLIDQKQLFAGCVVNAGVSFFGYDTGSNGVGCGLNHVQLVTNVGVQRLDGSKSAKEVFKKIPSQNASTSAQASTPDNDPSQSSGAPSVGSQAQETNTPLAENSGAPDDLVTDNSDPWDA